MGKWFGRREVLKGATLWAKRGEVSVLLGRNGAGKSTLLKVTAGIVRPDYGAVKFNGVVTDRPVAHHLAQGGLLFLPDRGLLSPRFTIGAHLRMVERWFGGDAFGVAEEFGVGDLLVRRPHEVSGGERRRAELALSVLRRPSVLLADEPLAGVEPADRDPIMEIFRSLARSGCAVVVTGHDVTDLMLLGDTLTWMTAGTTHHLGTPDKALEHDQFVREYLGPRRLSAAREALVRRRAQGVIEAE
jgi:lipopolysaccharide export system ATP-binding protein